MNFGLLWVSLSSSVCQIKNEREGGQIIFQMESSEEGTTRLRFPVKSLGHLSPWSGARGCTDCFLVLKCSRVWKNRHHGLWVGAVCVCGQILQVAAKSVGAHTPGGCRVSAIWTGSVVEAHHLPPGLCQPGGWWLLPPGLCSRVFSQVTRGLELASIETSWGVGILSISSFFWAGKVTLGRLETVIKAMAIGPGTDSTCGQPLWAAGAWWDTAHWQPLSLPLGNTASSLISICPEIIRCGDPGGEFIQLRARF